MEEWVQELQERARDGLLPRDGRVPLPGLGAEVEVLIDRWGVPHVYGASAEDCYAAQGYLHAAERLWHVDFMRRVAQGRLAELVGPPGLPTDRLFRTIGIGRTVRGWIDRLDDRSRAIAAAYHRGFRAAVASRPPPVEYGILATEPDFPADEEAALVDGLSLVLFLTFSLSANWAHEVLRFELARRIGPERARELTPFSHAESPGVLPGGGALPAAPGDLIGLALDAGLSGPAVGSNNWVVAGNRTTTGKPLLCNDPHLLVQMPAIWYEIHLSAPDLEVAGVSLPGLAGVVIGHNRRIAWGFTNTGADVEDLYLERLSENGTQYEFAGAWHPVEVIEETIAVRGEPEPHRHHVRRTRHGPLLTDLVVGVVDPQVREGVIADALALRWIHYDLVPHLSALEVLNRAGSWDEFRDAARRWPAAGQNMVYADVDGNIGYQFTGTVPIRRAGSGAAPVPGWTDAYEWEGVVPFEHLPFAFNPPQGFLATANNRVVSLDYPYYLTNDWEPGYRIRRIATLLAERERLSPADMARIQRDTASGVAEELLPLLLDALGRAERAGAERAGAERAGAERAGAERAGGAGAGPPTAGPPAAAAARKEIAAWDRRMEPEAVGGAVFTVWLHALCERLFREKLGDDLYDAYHRLKSWTTAWGYDATREILRAPDPYWVGSLDGDVAAARDRLVADAFADACVRLADRFGGDVSGWRWGRLHTVHFQHPIAQAVQALEPLLSIGPLEAPGGDDTICRGQFAPGEGFRAGAVASYRQIIDLADLDRSLAVITVGQSGNPASPHHHDQVEQWLSGEHHPMPFTREAVEAARESTLTFTP